MSGSMGNSLVGFLSSYDIFGKSLPGAVFFLGVISLLPAQLVQNSGGTVGGFGSLVPESLLPLVVIALALGLVFGEAVHTLAINSERFVAWIGNQAQKSAEPLRETFPEGITLLSPDYTQLTETGSRLYGQLSAVRRWTADRYYGTRDAFISHRRLFAQECISNYNDKRGRRLPNDTKHIYNRFEDRFNEFFDQDLPKEGVRELVEIYPLVTAVVTRSGGQQYRRFQSIYSFCRSMWVTLVLIAAAQTLLLINTPVELYSDNTLGAQIFTSIGVQPIWLPVTLTAIAIFFINATGNYKRHFVEYLVAEFALSTAQIPNPESREPE